MSTSYTKKIQRFITENYTYLVVILIATILMIAALIIDKAEPFGDNFPLLGNGFIQDYSQFVNSVKQVKSGNFFSFLEYGVGLTFDNYGMKTYSATFLLLRPWLYIIYYFVPESLFLPVFFMYYYFNYLIAGLVIIYYLTHRRNGRVMDKKDPRLIVFGLAYGMSAYTISFFIYYFRYMIYAPIIFLGIEKLIYDKKVKLYIFTLAYFMATEAYYAFILCIFAAMYFLVQKHGSIKEFFKNSVRFGVSSICAAGLSAAFLIPYFIRTRYSPYGEFDGAAPSFLKWFGSILSPLSEFRVAKDGMTTSSIEYRANIYCGIFVLLLVPVYLMLKDIDIGTRIKNMVLLLVIYIGFDNQLFNFIFHGFHYQWQVPNRFSSFFVFMLIVMAYDCVLRFDSLKKKNLLAGVCCSAVLLLIAYITNIGNPEIPDNSAKCYILSFVFLGLYLICFTLYALGKLGGKRKAALFVIAALEIVVSSVPTLKTSISYDGSKAEFDYIEKTEALAERNPAMKEPYSITERPGETFDQNISYMTGTHSLSFYTSSSYSQHFDLFYRWGMLFSKNITYYSTGSPLADMMLHVRYHTVNSDKYETISPYIPIDQEDNIVLYENPFYLPLGVVIDSNILDEWNKKAESYTNFDGAFDRDNAFSASFGTGDIYDSIDISRIYSEEELGDEGNYYMVEEDSEGNALYTFYLNSDVSGAIYMQIAQAPEYIGAAVDGEASVLYYYVPQTINLHEYDDVKLARWNVSNFTALYNILSRNTMTDQYYGDNTIGGNVVMPESGMLYLAMPNIPGFKAYVDGKETKIESYMDGIGLQLAPGEHSIELSYIPDGVVTGWQITIITALIMLIAYMLMLKKKPDSEIDSSKIKRRVGLVYMILALLPLPIIFDGSKNYAYENIWLIILVALILMFRKKDSLGKLTDRGKMLTILFCGLFLLMLPITDIVRGTALTETSTVFSIWKWIVYLPASIFSVGYIIGRLFLSIYKNRVIEGEEAKVVTQNRISKLLDSRKTCFIIIIVVSCMFLFSAMPGLWVQDDVARVMYSVKNNAPSDWDTYGYYLYVFITTIGGRFQFGANVVQTVIWILINGYILKSLESFSIRSMKIYTVLMTLAVTPMLYLSVMYKDSVFSMGVLALAAGIFTIIKNNKVAGRDILILGAASLFATLCRHGGAVAVVVGLGGLGIYLIKTNKALIKKYVIIPVVHILAYVLVYLVLFNAMDVEKVPAYVKYGTPLSIISAAAAEKVEFDEEDIKQLEEVMPVSDWAICYDKYWADGISRPWGFIGPDNLFKMNELIEEDEYGSFILELNLKLLLKHPVIWSEAFLGMSNDVWSISRPADMVEYYMPVSEIAKIPKDSNIDYSGLYHITNPISRFYNYVPWLHSAFLRGGLSLFICLLGVAVLFIKKKKRYILCILGVLVYSAVLMLAIPAPDARYVLPILEVVIFMVAFLCKKEQV